MLKIMNLFYWYCFFNRRRLMKKNYIKCFFNKIMMEFSDVLLVMYNECVLFIKKKLWMLNEKILIYDMFFCIFKII